MDLIYPYHLSNGDGRNCKYISMFLQNNLTHNQLKLNDRKRHVYKSIPIANLLPLFLWGIHRNGELWLMHDQRWFIRLIRVDYGLIILTKYDLLHNSYVFCVISTEWVQSGYDRYIICVILAYDKKDFVNLPTAYTVWSGFHNTGQYKWT